LNTVRDPRALSVVQIVEKTLIIAKTVFFTTRFKDTINS